MDYRLSKATRKGRNRLIYTSYQDRIAASNGKNQE